MFVVSSVILMFNFDLPVLPVQVKAEKSELQRQLECVGSDTGCMLSSCRETANYQHAEVLTL